MQEADWALGLVRDIMPECVKKNKIAQGDINIFSHFNIRAYVPFFEMLPSIPEVTSLIEKILSDLCSAGPN